MNVLLYVRVGSDNETGDGTARQQAALEAWAAVEGHEVVGTFVLSPGHTEQGEPAVAAIDRAVETGADSVAVWREDRLWRSFMGQQVVLARAQEAGVELVSATEGRRYNDADDRFMAGISALVAEHESATRSQRAKQAWARKRAREADE